MTTASELTGADLLRRVLRRHAAGITVVTVPGPAGFTATSFTSVSIDPPLVSFYLALTASTIARVRHAEAFAVHVLGEDQATIAAGFARSGTDRFAGIDWTPDKNRVPILDDVPAWLIARPTLRQEIGDHLLVVGEVVDAGGHGTGSALVHHDGSFARLSSLG